MDDLDLTHHLPMIQELVARYLPAEVRLTEASESIGGKLGQAEWGTALSKPIITLPRLLSAKEIEDSVLALVMRGHIEAQPNLTAFACSISDSAQYLKHLVLHEVAHALNRWPQEMETQCDLWAMAELEKTE